jgi:GT2 family glycosyltransferase
MELSVVIACLNGGPTIGEQLDALAAQSISEPWEVIVADNGSRDGSQELVRSYASRFPQLRLIDSSHRRGLSHARNAGAAAASGRSLAFCDQDDRVAAGWLEAMTIALRSHQLVAGRLEHDLLNAPWTIEVRGRPQAQELMTYEPGWPPFAFGCTLGVRKELHDRLGGFDESFDRGSEDADYCWRAQQLGSALVFVPDAATHYRFRDTLSAIYRQARNYGYSEVQFYAKHRALGLPKMRHPLRTGARRWLGTLRAFARARSRGRLGVALWLLGLRIGRLRGSLRCRATLL